MAASPRFRTKQATDVWSTRERLCLASSVLRSGDQNWVSVSRAIKPFGEASRPPDWFSQKNCALQYAELLEKVDAPKRKRGERSEGSDTPGDLIVRKLTMDRIEELKKVVYEEHQRHKKLKRELEMVRSGQLDEKLEDLLRGVQDEIRAKEIADNEHQKWLQEREQKVAALKVATSKGLYPLPIKNKRATGNSYNLTRAEELRRSSYQSEMNEQESNIESPLSEPLSIEVDESSSNVISHGITLVPESPLTQPLVKTSPRPPGLTITSSSTSPLLTSLLKSPSPATTPTTVTTLQASPKAPILGSALQGSTGSKHGECISPSVTGVSQRLTQGVPLPFFNPNSALATAAARQLAVATAAPSSMSAHNTITAAGFSSSSGDIGISPNSNMLGLIPISRPQSQAVSSLHSGQSATSSAPTLSRLLEMPPSMPGKLPPLPIVQPSTIISSETPVSQVIESSIASSESGRLPAALTNQNNSTYIGNVKIDSTTTWDSAILALQEVTASAKNESDLSQIEAQVASLVEGVCEVEDAFRDELDPEGTGLDVDMEAIVNEIMKEEIQVVSPNDSPQGQPDMSDIGNLQSTDILTVEEGGGTIEVIQQEIALEETEGVKSNINLSEVESSSEKEGQLAEDSKEEVETIREADIELSPDIAICYDGNADRNLKNPACEATQEVITETEQLTSTDQTSKVTTANAELESHPLTNVTSYNLEEVVTEEVVISEKDVIEASEEIDEKRQLEKSLVFSGEIPEGVVACVETEANPEIKTDQSDESSEIIPLTPATASSGRETSEPLEDECKLELQDPTLQQLEDDESVNLDLKPKAPSSVSDSIPNSPASTPQSSDDQENLKEYKVWKKAIMHVWRAVANHKNANVFLHPVTNDVAPGYHSIVFRPKDLMAIKKNVEIGLIRATSEFQRDVMLMFQNAIMYNSSDHDVYHMAVTMQKDFMEVIQLMVQNQTDAKVLRGREPRDKKLEGLKLETEFKEEDEGRRKRASTSESSDSRPKKRRRQED